MTVRSTTTRILTVNAGSTSVRLALFEARPDRRVELARQRLEAQPGAERATLAAFLSATGAPDVVIHRVVHGGELRETRPLDDLVRQTVAGFASLAPLHNPPSLAWAEACERALPGVTALAAFDTGFFQRLPEVASTYGLPREIASRLGLRRLGFHGLAHRSMWQGYHRSAPAAGSRVISLQLGGGCSAAALRDGLPVETSMGFSPLEGLLMASRPGDLDAGALLHLMEREGLGVAETRELLHRRCGLLGISAASGDLRWLLSSSQPEAALAVDVFCHRVRKYVGAYLAVLDGADAILIGGGAGEGSAELRRRIFGGLTGLGIRLDAQANAGAASPACISPPNSPVQLWVLPTDEESILVDEACAWLAARPG